MTSATYRGVPLVEQFGPGFMLRYNTHKLEQWIAQGNPAGTFTTYEEKEQVRAHRVAAALSADFQPVVGVLGTAAAQDAQAQQNLLLKNGKLEAQKLAIDDALDRGLVYSDWQMHSHSLVVYTQDILRACIKVANCTKLESLPDGLTARHVLAFLRHIDSSTPGIAPRAASGDYSDLVLYIVWQAERAADRAGGQILQSPNEKNWHAMCLSHDNFVSITLALVEPAQRYHSALDLAGWSLIDSPTGGTKGGFTVHASDLQPLGEGMAIVIKNSGKDQTSRKRDCTVYVKGLGNIQILHDCNGKVLAAHVKNALSRLRFGEGDSRDIMRRRIGLVCMACTLLNVFCWQPNPDKK